MKQRILFLCTGNSCRSQMAEGFARHLKSDRIEAHSAGLETHGLNPMAVKAMAEVGLDISRQRSKHVDDLRNIPFDYIITVCAHADQHCPIFPGNATIVHIPFDDPPALAKGAENEEQALIPYRRVRDQIANFIKTLPESLQNY